MTTFESFKSEWLTNPPRRVGDPLLIGRGETADTIYQCVSLIKQYMVEVGGIHVDWPGNALQFWCNGSGTPSTNPAILTRFNRVGDGSVQKGDIAIFKTAGHTDYLGTGHIGIATGNGDPNSIEVLEQNAVGSGTGLGRDAISTRFIARNRLAGVLRPIPVQTAPINPVLSHEAANLLKVCNKQPTNWYNLNGVTFEQVANSIAGTKNQGDLFPVGGIIRHMNGQSYAMSPEDYDRFLRGDRSTFNGINLGDLDEYVPPKIDPIPLPEPPKQQTVADYVPVELPSSYTEYTLNTTVKYYATAQMAANDVKPISTINRGKYLLYRSQDGMDCIVKEKGGIKYWVNPADNVAPPSKSEVPALPVQPPQLPEIVIQPEMAPVAEHQPDDLVVNGPNIWKAEAQYIFDDGLPISLTSTNSIPVKIKALDGRLPTTVDLPAHKELKLLRRFPYNGVWYYQDTVLAKADRYYALPVAMFPDPYQEDDKLATLDINRDGDVNFSDFVDYSGKMFKSGMAVINTVTKTIASKNVQAVRKSIDGIRAAKKKDKV